MDSKNKKNHPFPIKIKITAVNKTFQFDRIFLYLIGINHLVISCLRSNRAGNKVFVNRSLCSQKHSRKGITSSLKKISTPRFASGSIFFAALAG
jgi:hypothetical protein